jgi:mRNA interferase MazF
MNIKRGDVFLADLNPIIGSEIAKTRPVLVVSNDKNNTYSDTITVLPITSKNLEKPYPFEVILRKGTANLPKDSKVKADQIRTLDKSRISKFFGRLSDKEMEAVNNSIIIHLDLA